MLIEQYPFIDEEGVEHDNLIKHYSDEGKMILPRKLTNQLNKLRRWPQQL